MIGQGYSIKQIRQDQYDHNVPVCREYGVDINSFWKNPYTYLKFKFCIEASVYILYFLLRTNINPNCLTIIYCLCGIIGGVLLAIPNMYTIIVALLIFFLKVIVDNMDGHIARARNLTSLTGHCLDTYGALLGSLGFHMGLGFYVAANTQNQTYYYMTALIPFFYAARFNNFMKLTVYEELSSAKNSCKWASAKDVSKDTNDGETKAPDGQLRMLKKCHRLLASFLDDRARSVDPICLVILIEQFYPIMVTPYIFVLITARAFILFSGCFYFVLNDGAEKELIGKMVSIDRVILK